MNTVIEMYKNEGFDGFTTVKSLRNATSDIPTDPGVYIVVRNSKSAPKFLEVGTGGHFKGEDPNVDIATLEENWVNDSNILYIGKASGQKGLRQRIGQLLRFGAGKGVGHKGGCYLWQLVDSDNLLIAWKKTSEDARQVEKNMLEDFFAHHGKLPFANCRP